ncbi:hypothetical protein [Nitrospirillum iridis]|uniref:Twin-arginine translocation pathway signal n=1 Tax=Nitrospirillum iridis TaxID=765888 RepID=A0A7X0AWJ4_9PROT|nr:hypothetical protein [Nitrospirillum iridis]MBB6251437.1 hypothetical protein [Nitrospirillum iridis]
MTALSRRSILSAGAASLAVVSASAPVAAGPTAEASDADMWALLARWQALQLAMEHAPRNDAEEAEYDRRFAEADSVLLTIFRMPPRTAMGWGVKAYLLLHTQFGQGRHDALRPGLQFLTDGIEDQLNLLLLADVERLFGDIPRAA